MGKLGKDIYDILAWLCGFMVNLKKWSTGLNWAEFLKNQFQIGGPNEERNIKQVFINKLFVFGFIIQKWVYTGANS